MTNQEIILKALRYLAERCDGALAQDGQGFNKPDSFRGKHLASREYLLPEELAKAYNILRKYASGQLADGGITLPDEQATKAEVAQAIETRGKITLLVTVPAQLAVAFPYYAPFVQRIKTIPGARFVSNGTKFWTVPLSSGQKLVEAFPKFHIESEVRSAFENYEPSPYIGKITLEGDSAIFAFEYDAAIVAYIRKIPGAQFNGGRKVWRVPVTQIKAGQFPQFQMAPEVVSRIEVIASKQEVAKQQTANLLTYVDKPLPSGRTLFAHQKTGVQFLIEHRRAILADDMGLGKTTQALVAASLYKLPVIVICPASLQINWKREAELVGVEITVYSWAKIPAIPERNDYVLICDEAHYAQSLKSARTKAMLMLAKSDHCQSLILLTGTPIKNGRPANLFPLLAACNHPITLNRSIYEARYCNAHATRFTKWDTTGASNLDELHAKTKDVMLRRTKKECLDLPEKTRVIRGIDASPEANKIYHTRLIELRKQYMARVSAGEITNEAQALGMIGQLRQAASVTKIDTTIEIAHEVIEEGGQIVIFVAFHDSGEQIAKALNVNLFSGDTPLSTRQELVDRFQSGIDKAFVCTIGAGGVGITLTAAQTVILVDRPWTPGESSQAEDRLHRIGQKSAVTSIWLQYGECDKYIDSIIQAKQKRIDLVLAGQRKTMRGTGTPGQLASALAETLLGLDSSQALGEPEAVKKLNTRKNRISNG